MNVTMALMVAMHVFEQIWMNYCANIYASGMDGTGWKDGRIVLAIDKQMHVCMHNDMHERIAKRSVWRLWQVQCANIRQMVLNDVLRVF